MSVSLANHLQVEIRGESYWVFSERLHEWSRIAKAGVAVQPAKRAAMSKPSNRFGDVIASVFLCVILFALACSFNVTERFVSWAALHGTWRVGEFLILLVLAAVSAYACSTRRPKSEPTPEPSSPPAPPERPSPNTSLQNAVSKADIAIWTVSLINPEDVYVSPACRDIWGGACGQCDGSALGDAGLQRGGIGLPLVSAETQGSSLEGEKEYRIAAADGAVRWIRERTFLADSDDTPAAWLVGVCEDITEARQAEEERAQYNTQLFHEIKMDAVSKLAGGVAHDFNNYLTVILNEAEMLRDSLAPGEEQATQATAIVKTANRASNLMRQLLAVSREQTLSLAELSVNELIDEAAQRAKDEATEGVEIVLKKTDEPLWASADRQSMVSALDALIANAFRAMPDGGTLLLEAAPVVLTEKDCRVLGDTAGAQAGSFVALTVGDTGVGMTEDVQQRVFEPFFSTRSTGDDSGLGLATVYGVIRQHGGFVSVDSEPELGATFRVYLPRVETPPAPVAPAPAPQPTTGSETVLVAEDEPMVRHVAVRVLKHFGYTVLEAENGVEALQVAAQFDGDIHVLFTDMVMPEMDGKELAENLVKERPGIKVIFTSGYSADKLAETGIDLTGGAFIQKPFNRQAVGRVVREVLESGE